MHATEFARRTHAESETPLKEHLHATAHIVAGAANGHVRDAIESVEWERRGFLGRLKRDNERARPYGG